MRFETKPMRYCGDGYYQFGSGRWYVACRAGIDCHFVLPRASTPHQIVLVFDTEPVEDACETRRLRLQYAGADALRESGHELSRDTHLWWWVEIIREGQR